MKTAKENRRANVKKLVVQYGGQAEFAKEIEKDPAQISQWTTAAKSHRGKPRGMSDDMARYIEENCGLDRGWMDIDHDTSSEAVASRVLPVSRSDEGAGGADVPSTSSEARKMKPGEARPEKRQHTTAERPIRRRGQFDGKSMGQRIAELREAKGWSQAELARRVGVKRASANHWETGETKNIKNIYLVRLAAVLGCSVQYLVTGHGKVQPRHDDEVRLAFLEQMCASVQLTSDGKWTVWGSVNGRVCFKQAGTLRAAIDSARESLEK